MAAGASLARQVLSRLGLTQYPQDLRLEMLAGTPVCRVSAPGSPPQTISALTGEGIDDFDARRARQIIERVTKTRLAGLTISVSGVVIAWRALQR